MFAVPYCKAGVTRTELLFSFANIINQLNSSHNLAPGDSSFIRQNASKSCDYLDHSPSSPVDIDKYEAYPKLCKCNLISVLQAKHLNFRFTTFEGPVVSKQSSLHNLTSGIRLSVRPCVLSSVHKSVCVSVSGGGTN